jgi:hypothetical protein
VASDGERDCSLAAPEFDVSYDITVRSLDVKIRLTFAEDMELYYLPASSITTSMFDHSKALFIIYLRIQNTSISFGHLLKFRRRVFQS